MTATKQAQSDSNLYQYIRELERFIKDKASRNSDAAMQFVKDTVKLKEVLDQNAELEKDFKRLVVRYCQYLDGTRTPDVKFTDSELNTLIAVHNMRKRDLKETKETLRSFAAGDEALDAVEVLISKNLRSLQAFMVVNTEIQKL
jgi:Fic family protein